jgi:hypothetical protein
MNGRQWEIHCPPSGMTFYTMARFSFWLTDF